MNTEALNIATQAAAKIFSMQEYYQSYSVREQFKKQPIEYRYIISSLNAVAELMIELNGYMIMELSNKEDERKTKILMFQGWQEKALMHGGGYNLIDKRALLYGTSFTFGGIMNFDSS